MVYFNIFIIYCLFFLILNKNIFIKYRLFTKLYFNFIIIIQYIINVYDKIKSKS